jgi:hypothetical protein
VLPFSEDLDAEKIHVQVPTRVIFLCGGPVSSLSDAIPRSLRDAFYKILDNPVLRKRDILLAEEITGRLAVFDNYKNILELETDLAQIVELIVLFCESEGRSRPILRSPFLQRSPSAISSPAVMSG